MIYVGLKKLSNKMVSSKNCWLPTKYNKWINELFELCTFISGLSASQRNALLPIGLSISAAGGWLGNGMGLKRGLNWTVCGSERDVILMTGSKAILGRSLIYCFYFTLFLTCRIAELWYQYSDLRFIFLSTVLHAQAIKIYLDYISTIDTFN